MLNDRPLRVLVVDDTVTYRRIVSDVLTTLDGVEVVGSAANGKIALNKIATLQPDLLTLDLEMPEIDGLEVLRRLPDSLPIGAIMLSAFTAAGATATLEALQLGAFDFVLKPSGTDAAANAAVLQRELKQKIDAYARQAAVRGALRPKSPAPVPPAVVRRAEDRPVAPAPAGKPELVAIGVSTGGPPALTTVIPQLPGDLAAPVVIVQHMPPKFTQSLAEDLDRRSALTVREAGDGDVAAPGTVLIAPGARQMKLERSGGALVARINEDPPERNCRPSVDYLLRSVAHVCGGRALALIMTGMGDDGALGCRLLKRRGAQIMTQSAETCVVYGMPKAPTEEGLADVVAPLDQIAAELVRLTGRRAPACT